MGSHLNKAFEHWNLGIWIEEEVQEPPIILLFQFADVAHHNLAQAEARLYNPQATILLKDLIQNVLLKRQEGARGGTFHFIRSAVACSGFWKGIVGMEARDISPRDLLVFKTP